MFRALYLMTKVTSLSALIYKDEKLLGIFFEDGTKELLKHHPDVKYVRGMDAVTRLPVWHEVKEDGLFSYKPKEKTHYDEQNWSYSDLI